MGQDDEETAELIATMQKDHVAMKTWYNDDSASHLKDLKEKYGSSYPSFWRDVLHWKGWKPVRKAYLQHLSKQEKQSEAIPKKRRSRWAADADSNGNNNGDNKDSTSAANPHVTKRRSRWARLSDNPPNSQPAAPPTNAAAKFNITPVSSSTHSKPSAASGILGLLPGMPAGMTQDQLGRLSQLQTRLRVVNEKLATLDFEAIRVDNLPRNHPDRSPSPPPVYGSDGIRKNTRAVRWRERYTNERQDCLEQIMDLNPALRPPGFVKRKRSTKVYVPVHEHPTYNFIGLIIGPRGKTQKEMESKTGCKIAIRGKGSIKEGARGRRDGKPMDGDDEPLHVVITGDDQASVDKASDMIQQMLVVIDDEKNVHKQQQLRELALLNGTLKDEEFCHICAEKGHRTFECPKRFNMAKAQTVVKCAICGDSSHPTRDCPLKAKEGITAQNQVSNETQLDNDYQNFMDELDGKKKTPTADTNAATGLNPTSLPPSIAATTAVTASGTPSTVLPPPIGIVPPATAAVPGSVPTLPQVPQAMVGIPPPPPPTAIGATATAPVTATTAYPPPPPNLYYPTAATATGYPPPYQQHPQPPLPPVAPPGYPVTGYPPTSVPPPQYPPPPQQQQQQQPYHVPQQQAYGNYNANGGYEEETSGWDYRSYYGTDQTGGDGAGAGGFNWWESS